MANELSVPSPAWVRLGGQRSADPSRSAFALSSPRFPARAGKQVKKASPAGTMQARLWTCPGQPPLVRGKGTACVLAAANRAGQAGLDRPSGQGIPSEARDERGRERASRHAGATSVRPSGPVRQAASFVSRAGSEVRR